MQERRKVQRKNLMAYSQVFDLYTGHLLGYLGDLHLQGAMVIGEKLLEENTNLTLAIELPELLNTAASRITIPVRVAWCQPDISPEFFNIGFEFSEVKPGQAALIEAIMSQYEFRRVEPPNAEKPAAEE
jgi:hypothetical protein